MDVTPLGSTQASLLERLADPGDEDAWREFVGIYAPHVYTWAKRHGMQDCDAADVTQIVLGRLVKGMQTFRYDPAKGRFRGWLRTVTANAVRSFATRDQRMDRAAGGTSVNRRISSLVDTATPLDDLQSVLDQQANRELLAAAESRVRVKVKPSNWRAWEMTVRMNVAPADVATRLGMPPSHVYVARSRITNMLRQEVQRLGISEGMS